MKLLNRLLTALTAFQAEYLSDYAAHQMSCHCDACSRFTLNTRLDQVRVRQLWH